jgi:DNA primase
MADDKIKEEIRNRLDIVDVVGRYVRLKPAGQNHKGPCPFHKEKTPSFTVNSAKGMFHCFGCGKGGDVFSFLMEIEGQSFPEVLRACAEETGIKLETTGIKPKATTSAITLTKTQLLSIHAEAARFFCTQLRQNPEAINYLKSRGLTGQTAKDFLIGYAPAGWDSLTTHLQSKNISLEALKECGLAVTRPDGASAYDRFRDRIIFPVCDMSGKPIAFGGRALTAENNPKYLNSPETPLYQKSRTLYGLSHAREAMKEKDTALCVEGYMDYLALYQAGIRYCIASCGTALTPDHGKLLRRFVHKVVLVFDGDEAGQNAAERGCITLVPFEMDVRVLILPEGEDPDTCVAKEGSAAMEERIANAIPALDFLMQRGLKRRDVTTAQGKSALVDDLVPFLSGIKNTIVYSEYLRSVAGRLGLKESVVAQVVREKTVNIQDDSGRLTARQSTRYAFLHTLEGNLLSLLVKYPAFIESTIEELDPEIFADSFSKNIYSCIIESFGRGPTLETLLDTTEDPAVRDVLSAMAVGDMPVDNPEQEIAHAISRLRIKSVREAMRHLSAQMRNERDIRKRELLIAEHRRLAVELKELDG